MLKMRFERIENSRKYLQIVKSSYNSFFFLKRPLIFAYLLDYYSLKHLPTWVDKADGSHEGIGTYLHIM